MLSLRHRRWGLPAGVCASTWIIASCASRPPAPVVTPAGPKVAVAVPESRPSEPPTPVADPIAVLLATSTRHYEEGARELKEGHLEAARAKFNLALEVLMLPARGARTEPRVREQFDRLVHQISAQEAMALVQGDGFRERQSEPAAIDALLDASKGELPASPETRDAVAADAAATTYDIDIPLTPRVLAFVEMYTNNARMKSFLEEGLSRGAKYLPMVQAVFRAEGLPLDLAYVPLVESAFKPSALSRAKARGIWQFMPGTGVENGLKRDWYIDERADPEKATRAAAKFLQSLFERFGDWHLALASYNGGPGRMQRAMKQSGKTDFWEMRESSKYLPRETRDYVPLILAAVIVARNPDRYGLTIAPHEAPAFETVTLQNPVDIRLAAEWAETPVQTIQELNPELRRWTTPLRGDSYDLRVPIGAADRVRAGLETTAPEDLAPLNRHTVTKGETLRTIARTLKVSHADLAEANYLSTSARLEVGQELIVPRQPTLLLAARTGDDSAGPSEPSAAVVRAVNADDQLRPAAAPVRAARVDRGQPGPARRIHLVRRGDTLTSIAQLYRTTVASLKEWNRLRGNTITVGQRLTVAAGRAIATN
jgi:membrane-bound lytic murein transglycosylase D